MANSKPIRRLPPEDPNDTEADDILADGLMNVATAAQFLAVSKGAIYAAMNRGELPYVLIGRARRIPKRGLIAFAKANLHGSIE